MFSSLLFPENERRLPQVITDPGELCKKESTPATLYSRPAKHPFRNSLASQSSSTSASGSTHSQRYSVASTDSNMLENSNSRRWSAESDYSDHMSPRTSYPPSNRFFLSGKKSSEAFRNQELSRFHPSAALRHVKSRSKQFGMPSVSVASSPISSRPSMDFSVSDRSSTSGTVDPWSMSLQVAQDNAICSAWLQKYDTTAFTFTRSWKRRYIVLVDRTVHVYKSQKQTSLSREHFILTHDTLVFVSDEFRKGYVLELRKPLCRWCVRCESAAQMKTWLQTIKKIIACEKFRYPERLTASVLDDLKLTDNGQIVAPSDSLPPTPTSPLATEIQRLQIDTDYVLDLTALLEAPSPTPIRPPRISIPPVKKPHAIDHLPMPLQWWKREQAFEPEIDQGSGTLSHRYNPVERRCPKRQSLAQIPGWEKNLPPQMPPPRTQLPPIPHSMPSSSIVSHSPSSTLS